MPLLGALGTKHMDARVLSMAEEHKLLVLLHAGDLQSVSLFQFSL